MGARNYYLSALGDDVVPGTGAGKTTVQRAAELKAVLDAVATNDQAKSVANKTYSLLVSLSADLGAGVSAGMVRDYLQPTTDRLRDAIIALPLLDGPVDDSWTGVPNGARRAVEGAASSIWALQKLFPPGSLDAEDAQAFADGFADTIAWEIQGITGLFKKALDSVAKGLGIDLSTLVIVLGVGVSVVALGQFVDLKALLGFKRKNPRRRSYRRRRA
jgi:hypothetical protein